MQQYIRWLSVADRYTKMHLDRHLAKLGLNSSQYMYVIRVCQDPGMTQDQFLASFNIHPSNITRALAAPGAQRDGQAYLASLSHRAGPAGVSADFAPL